MTETRVHLYDSGTPPPDAGKPAKGDAALPPLGFSVTVEPTDAARAAARVRRLLPDWELDDGEPEARRAGDRLEGLLAAAQPTRALEVVTLDGGDGGGTAMPWLRRGGAIAIALAAPGALDLAAVEKTLADRLGGAFADADGARVLKLPLVDDWALSLIVRDGVLVVATSPALALEVLRELPPKALTAEAPLRSRLDVRAAEAGWRRLESVTGARESWMDSSNRDWVTEVVPSLFTAANVSLVEGVAWRDGDRLVERVVYR
jgi:hypothetical protein